MVNQKEKDSPSIPDTEKTETAITEMNTNPVLVSETEENMKQITEEAKHEENEKKEEDNKATAEKEESIEESDEEEMNKESSEEEENNNENPMDEDIPGKEKKEEENKNDYPIEEDIIEEKKVEEMEEKAKPVSTEPVKKSRKRRRNNAVAAKNKSNSEEKAKTVAVAEDKKMVVAKEEKTPSKKAKTNGGPESLGQKVGDKDKPESSGKKMPGKKTKSTGMIFMCSSKTKKDCYRYKVFGLPASKKDMVQTIYKGMRLFLYDVDLKMMYGIYKAAAPGGFNIEPKAFNSAYPSQVRFTVLEECNPLGEEKFKKAIKENYYSRNKFNCQLNSDQVKKLCKLFAYKGTTKPKMASVRSVKERAEPRPSSGRSRARKREADEQRPRGTRRYVDRPVVYEREARAPPMGPMHNLHHLPARVPFPSPAALSYAYEMDTYGRDHPLESHGHSYYDNELTRRDEIGSRYNYVPAAALPARYHYPEPASDYRSSVRVRADYHIPAEGRRTEYHIPVEGRMAEYHIPAEGRRAEYHIPAEGRRAEYHIPAEGRWAQYYIPAEGRQMDYRSSRDGVYRL